MSEKNNLFEKIQLVSNEVRNITKDMTVGSGNYAYKAVSDIDVTLAVKDAETKYKLVSIPIKQELINSEILKVLDGAKEKITYVDTIKLTLKIIDLEDISSFIEIESFGKGIDSGDKGFGKASTYARKYALLNAYKIATGEDPDNEKSKQQEQKKTTSDKRIAVVNYLEKNISLLQEVLKYFNIGSLDDMTEANINAIYKTYSDKKLI
ncbi:MAG: ERF family protein [Aliarcobacter sp.]|jgi:hypothetical protein|nr:ERF family protein [Aliarcobacter sp.]